jgi:hypothetical protein
MNLKPYRSTGLLSLSLIWIALFCADANAAEPWALTRDSTPAEQREVDEYLHSPNWSLQVDFHDRATAEAVFVPVSDDLRWLKSCRRPGNVSINGALRLETKPAKDCRAKWSTGYVVTKSFQQLYGYFETRMKITKKPGVNNAFWLTGKHLEIDVVEARFPNIIHWTVHDWGNPRRAKRCVYSAEQLANKMNDYGVLWLPDRLVYTFNGKAVCTIETRFPSVPVEVRFSTAVADFEEHKVSPADDPAGTEMDVAWVRVAALKQNH